MKGDLEDLCVLVAETGLGTPDSRPGFCNFGTTTPLTLILKNEDSLSAWLEHVLTAPNTFKNDDGTDVNVLTCNCHFRHDTEQIDFTLSSDDSLRSWGFDSSAAVSYHRGLTATLVSQRLRTLERVCSQASRLELSRWSIQ